MPSIIHNRLVRDRARGGAPHSCAQIYLIDNTELVADKHNHPREVPSHRPMIIDNRVDGHRSICLPLAEGNKVR